MPPLPRPHHGEQQGGDGHKGDVFGEGVAYVVGQEALCGEERMPRKGENFIGG